MEEREKVTKKLNDTALPSSLKEYLKSKKWDGEIDDGEEGEIDWGPDVGGEIINW